ncbi:MAG: HTH domain-containing protein [Patescibacteria group bacterium]|nr:HTH domain-containing protein [Patescibacteria group bacterium]
MNTTNNTTVESVDSSSLLSNLFMLLSPKEKEILVRRFSLENNTRETLESIGQSFSVTRERIRQIEALALSKLNRTMSNNGLQSIISLAEEILQEHGGIMREDLIVSELVNNLSKEQSDLDMNLMRLALAVMKNVKYQTRSDKTKAYYRFSTISKEDVNKVHSALFTVLSGKTDVVEESSLISDTQKVLAKKHSLKPAMFVRGCLEIHQGIVKTEEGYGLATWRHICPKNLRDKAYIVLRDSGEPLHFTEISNQILDRKFDSKMVTVQAVHNELIRNDRFVLIGRGKYALAEWGYSEGTVADVIEQLLRDHARPLTKREIVEGVLSMRNVQEATISLNLQKNPQFVRVDRALYTLDMSKREDKTTRRRRG